MSKENENMKLWNSVCETDPKHTKKVTFGRGFTAIDPMYQVRKATEALGEAGSGWGWEVAETHFLPTNVVAVRVRLWIRSPENFIEHYGQCGLYTDKAESTPDKDCMKKATTDAVTKCLSYFGFSADVFLGKFDDNRYVAEMEQKHKEDSQSTGKTPQEPYKPAKKENPPTDAEKKKKAEEYAATCVSEVIKITTPIDLDFWEKDKTRAQYLEVLKSGYPELHGQIEEALKQKRSQLNDDNTIPY